MKRTSDDGDIDSNSIWEYFKLGWELWKDYYKPFMAAQLIALVCFSGVSLVMLLLIIAMGNGSSTTLLSLEHGLVGLLQILFLIPAFIIQIAFMGSLYGMGNEILSSGDYYTNLKSSFTYFKKYWWQYTVVAGIQMFILLTYARVIFFLMEGLIGVIIFIIITFLWISLGYLLSAALASTGSVRKAFKHSFFMFKKDPKTIIILSMLFIVPIVLIDFLLYGVMNIFFPDSILVIITQIIFILILYFVFIPYITLIETIVYHSKANQEGLNDKI